MKLASLEDVFTEQLSDLYSAEKQLVSALPRVAQAASSPKLREAIQQHLNETRGHARRLEQLFRDLRITPSGESCKAMEGLIEEGEQVIAAEGQEAAKDAALIAAAQRVEHYEIAGYGTARTLAHQLELGKAEDLLDETLDEESAADKKLTTIATGGFVGFGVNERARQARMGSGRSTRASTRARSVARSGRSTGERTKEELYREAKRLGVEGRSKMTKAQLERAVERARR